MTVAKKFGDKVIHKYRIENGGDVAITVNAYASLGGRGVFGSYDEIHETIMVQKVVVYLRSYKDVTFEYIVAAPLAYGAIYHAKARVNNLDGKELDDEIIHDAIQIAEQPVPGKAVITNYGVS